VAGSEDYSFFSIVGGEGLQGFGSNARRVFLTFIDRYHHHAKSVLRAVKKYEMQIYFGVILWSRL
jgi:peptidoglycan/xylan/chitin deacetylase (PgdA/CDA1 family)